MNYNKIYTNIINNAKNRNIIDNNIIIEKHHITPKSLGGSNEKNNIVKLTLREHYICHLLLCKIYPKSKAMIRAIFMMGSRLKNKNSKNYQKIKEQHIKNLKKQIISEKQKIAISKANKNNKARLGHTNSEETRLKISFSKKGWIPSEKTKVLWSKQRKGNIPWNKGKKYKIKHYSKNRKSREPYSQETIEKMRQSRIKWHENKRNNINV